MTAGLALAAIIVTSAVVGVVGYTVDAYRSWKA